MSGNSQASVAILNARKLIEDINAVVVEQQANLRARRKLEEGINELVEKNQKNKEALDIATHAIEILRQVSDEAAISRMSFVCRRSAGFERFLARSPIMAFRH